MEFPYLRRDSGDFTSRRSQQHILPAVTVDSFLTYSPEEVPSTGAAGTCAGSGRDQRASATARDSRTTVTLMLPG